MQIRCFAITDVKTLFCPVSLLFIIKVEALWEISCENRII